MAAREHKQRPSAERRTEDAEEAEVATAPGADASQLKADLDDLLDEIDDVLETNAEEFVKSYVQKGGQ